MQTVAALADNDESGLAAALLQVRSLRDAEQAKLALEADALEDALTALQIEHGGSSDGGDGGCGGGGGGGACVWKFLPTPYSELLPRPFWLKLSRHFLKCLVGG